MLSRLRTRLADTILRFDASASTRDAHYTVINTATHLGNLIQAIRSLAKPANWRMMSPTTRLQYFGFVLEILRGVAARDDDRRPAGSSPYVSETAMDHNLYLQMVSTQKCAPATNLLHQLFDGLQAPLSPNQPAQIVSLLKTVKTKHDRYGKSRSKRVATWSGDFVARLQNVATGGSMENNCHCFTSTDISANSCYRPTQFVIPLLTYQEGHRVLPQNAQINCRSSRFSYQPHVLDCCCSRVIFRLVDSVRKEVVHTIVYSCS